MNRRVVKPVIKILLITYHKYHIPWFTDDDLLGYVRDLFVAGTDTTISTIRWSLVYLINRPKVQRKVRKKVHTHLKFIC